MRGVDAIEWLTLGAAARQRLEAAARAVFPQHPWVVAASFYGSVADG